MLVGVIALMRPGTVMQILWGLGICVGSSFVSLLIRPYSQLDDGWLNNLCLAQLQFVLFCGLLIRLKVDLFEKEGKGDSTYDAEYAIGIAVVASHISVMVVALCLLAFELINAPRHQAALRANVQRKTEASRRSLELWSKGRRMALMRKAKRQKEGGDEKSGGQLKGQVMELETEQLAREAELRDEYDDLQKEIQSLGLINDTDAADGPASGDAETHNFLVDEKERMTRKKNALEQQMQSIISENKQNVEALEIAMDAKKVKAKTRLQDRLAKRKKRNSSVGGLMTMKRQKSNFKRSVGIGHNGERNIDGNHPNSTQVVPIGEDGGSSTSSTIMHLQEHQKRVHLEEATMEAKNETVFKLLAYYGNGDASVDASVFQYIEEHTDNKGAIDIPRDDSGSTLLTAAVRVGNAPVVQVLLSHGSQLTETNQDKATCLHYAAYSGNVEIVDLILATTLRTKRGNLMKAADEPTFLQALDVRGNTAASYAAIAGHSNLAAKLGLTSTSDVANLTSNLGKRSDALSKWRRSAWRKGISKVHEKKAMQVNFKQMIALARARKGVENQLKSHGDSPFDPSEQEEHSAVKDKLTEQIQFLEQQLTEAKSGMGESKETEINELKQELSDIRHKDEVLVLELEQEATERRRLHNTIEDMKGKWVLGILLVFEFEKRGCVLCVVVCSCVLLCVIVRVFLL